MEFNSGKNGGMVKVGELAARLNTVEKDINALKEAFSDWIPANPVETDAKSIKALLTAWEATKIEPTRRDQIENSKITH